MQNYGDIQQNLLSVTAHQPHRTHNHKRQSRKDQAGLPQQLQKQAVSEFLPLGSQGALGTAVFPARQQLPRKSGKTLRKGRLSPMRLFDVLGPVMIGPSSSHTAGAAKIGYTAQKLLGEVPAQADIGLYGSFATTGKGHGTDRALVAGLLGLRPDDPRLPDSFALAAQRGMQFSIHPVELRSAHPNTAVLTLTSRTGRQLSLKAASVGGGRIRVTEIDGVPADFGGDSNTLIIHNEDTPGCIAEVTMALALRRINIASMQVFRAAAGGYAVMVLECDSHIPHALERQLAVMPGLLKVTCLNVDEPEETEE